MQIIELTDIKEEYRENPLVRRIVELHNVLVPYENKCHTCIQMDHDICSGYHKQDCSVSPIQRALSADLMELKKQYCKEQGLQTPYEIDDDLTYFMDRNKEDYFPTAAEIRASNKKHTEAYIRNVITDIYQAIKKKAEKRANTVLFGCSDKKIVDELTAFFTKKGFKVKYLESSYELAISWADETEESTV